MAEQQDFDTNQPSSGGADATGGGDAAGSVVSTAKQAVLEKTSEARGQAGDKARSLAEDGKAKATGALDQLSQLLSDAATQVDDKLGEQYGQYARAAADRVQGYSSAIDGKDIDDLIADARTLVQKSPAVAIGAAAAIGFVIARLVSSGLDQRDA